MSATKEPCRAPKKRLMTTGNAVDNLRSAGLEKDRKMEKKKLRPKYMVMRLDEKGETFGSGMNSTDPGNTDSPFVLMPAKDPAAFRAMVCYAQYCEPDLRAEICTWLNKIAGTKPLFGTQGVRNYAKMRAEEINLGLR